MVPNHPNHQLMLEATRMEHKVAFSLSKQHTHVHFGNPGNIAPGYSATSYSPHTSPQHQHRKVFERPPGADMVAPNMLFHGSEAHKYVNASALGGVSTSTGTAAPAGNSKSRKPSGNMGAMGSPTLPYPSHMQSAPDVAMKKGE